VNIESALLGAIRRGDVPGVLRCMDEGASIAWRDGKGFGALFHAVFQRQWEVVDALLARGADIDLPEHQGWTPLFWASFNGYADIVGQLIARGADANAVTHVGDRPLFMATYKRGMRTWCVYAGGRRAVIRNRRRRSRRTVAGAHEDARRNRETA